MNQVLKHGSYTRTQGAEAGAVYPRFFDDVVVDPVASAQKGFEVFKSEERVEIIFPGNQHTKPVFKVTQEHIDRWPEEYKAFKAGGEMAAHGVPIEQWPILKRAQVLTLKAAGFRTVEEIAAMSDLATQKIGMGGQRLKQLAQVYLDETIAQEEVARVTAENERQKQEIVELKDMVGKLKAASDEMFTQLQALRNAPSPIATHIPAQHDPAEAARVAMPAEPPAPPVFADLPAPRQRRKGGQDSAA